MGWGRSDRSKLQRLGGREAWGEYEQWPAITFQRWLRQFDHDFSYSVLARAFFVKFFL